MERADSLKREDAVTVTIYGPDGSRLYEMTNSGFHSLEAAVSAAVESSSIGISPEDCVFEVKNDTSGVVHRYRLNAHGHLKLII